MILHVFVSKQPSNEGRKNTSACLCMYRMLCNILNQVFSVRLNNNRFEINGNTLFGSSCIAVLEGQLGIVDLSEGSAFSSFVLLFIVLVGLRYYRCL